VLGFGLLVITHRKYKASYIFLDYRGLVGELSRGVRIFAKSVVQVDYCINIEDELVEHAVIVLLVNWQADTNHEPES
jgi:hypothetical protein